MNFLTRFSLKNATAIAILCIMVILGGIYSTTQLKQEQMPDMSFPIVAVITAFPGASPSDIQDKLTKPFEDLLSSVDGIKTITSTSSENISAIIVQFDFSANMDDAQRKVEDALKGATLPEGAIAPKISRFNFNSMPMLTVSISNDKVAAEDLEQKVRDNVIPSLSGVSGVAQAQLASDSQKAVYIKLLPSKLKEYNLTSQQVTQLLQANNVSFPTGSVSLNNTVQPIRVTGQLSSLDELKNLQIPVMPNTQDALKSTFTQMGEGMASLGKGVASLGQAVGALGQGMAGMNRALTGQIQLLSAIQQTQAQLFADQLALNAANQTLKDDKATEAQKNQASATIQQTTMQIQITQAALAQMQGQLKQIQTQMAQAQTSSSQAPAGNLNSGASGSSLKVGSASTGDTTLKQVTLKDIADISVGTGDTTSYSRMNGNPGVIMQVYKTQEANTVDVSNSVQQKLQQLKSSLPAGTKIDVVEDGATTVKESINGMLREGLLGALFAFLVILLFLRNFRSTLIAVVSIPLSVLITLICLKQLNITLNILTLGGLSVATGRIVDDSIVVIENIYRRLHTDDVRNVELIKQAAKEVTSAITSSTLTTVAVFLPIGFVSGFAGVMFRPFAVTVAIALLSSLLVAVTVIPVMSKLLLLKANVKSGEFHEGRLMRQYSNFLTWSLNHKVAVLLIALLLLGGSLALIPHIGTSFIPEASAKKLSISIDYPAGTDIQVVNNKAKEIEKLLSTDKDVTQYQTTVAAASSSNPMAALTTKSPGIINVKLSDNANVNTVMQRLKNEILPNAGNAKIDLEQAQDQGGGGSSNNLEVMVTGDNLANIKQGAEILTKELAIVPGLDHIANNLSDSKPEIAINVDQKKASSYGLSAAQVGMTLRDLLNDSSVTTMQVDNKSLDVRMGLKLDPLHKLADVSSIQIQAPTGTLIKLADIAQVKEEPGAVSITNSDGHEYADVTATITDKDTGAVSKRVQDKIKSLKLPQGVSTEMGGVTQMMGDTFRQMGIAMLVAIFAVFLVMMIGLGSATAPLAILFSLPLAAIGSFIALFVTGVVLDAPAMIGALMLIGIVVTNAIVLIDRVQQGRREGTPIRAAIIDAGKIRMRPILMTAIATIAALMPLALGISKGTMISQSLAIVVIGGLTTSTLLTLVIVPVAYEMLENIKIRLGGKEETGELAA